MGDEEDQEITQDGTIIKIKQKERDKAHVKQSITRLTTQELAEILREATSTASSVPSANDDTSQQ